MAKTELEKLIEEITSYTCLKAKDVEKMFKEELAETDTEEEAAHNVRMRVKYLF